MVDCDAAEFKAAVLKHKGNEWRPTVISCQRERHQGEETEQQKGPVRGPFIFNDRTDRHRHYRTSPRDIPVRQEFRVLYNTSGRWSALAGEPPAIWPGGLLPILSGMGQAFDFVLDGQFLTFEVVDGYVVR